jgi:hypothetical protein
MTTILLKDAPGAADFIDRCVAAAADMALAFVGEPNDKVMVCLNQTRANLQRDLAPQLGAEIAEAVAQAFTKAVLAQKAEIEAIAPGKHGGLA